MVPGCGEIAGQALVDHKMVQKIQFTGSTPVGKHILSSAAATMKKVGLELGGKSPIIISEDADLDLAASISQNACFVHSGQFCMAGTRVYVHENIYDAFVAKSAKLAQKRIIGSPFDENVQGGPVVSKDQLDKVMAYINSGIQQGARVVAGGKRMKCKGYFIEPTIFTDVDDSMAITREEIFGPVMCIMKFKKLNEAIERCNNSVFGLAGGVVTESLNTALNVSRKLRVGTVWINSWGTI